RPALEGALSGVAPWTATHGPWRGPVLQAGALDEANERRLVADHQGRLVLAAYRDFDPRRPVAVLVHGYTGAPDDFHDMPERLRAAGYQVLLACFDDEQTPTPEAGAQLAAALTQLRAAHYRPGTPLQLVG